MNHLYSISSILSTMVDIEKKAETVIYHGRYVVNGMKIIFTVFFSVFMQLLSFCCEIIGHFSNKKLNLHINPFGSLIFYLFMLYIFPFMLYIFQFCIKSIILCFPKHIYHGRCNFRDSFVSSTTLDMFCVVLNIVLCIIVDISSKNSTAFGFSIGLKVVLTTCCFTNLFLLKNNPYFFRICFK